MPPQVQNATKYAFLGQVFIGGPLGYVRDASLLAGIPAETTATATTGAIINPYDATITLAGGYSAFRTSKAAVRITGDLGDNWFVYEIRDDATLSGVRKVAGKDETIAAGAAVSQWFELTPYLAPGESAVEFSEQIGEDEIYWQATLKGHSWNSLVMFQDAAVLAVGRVWDDVLASTDTDREDDIVFQGYLDLPSVTADSEGNEWSAGVTGRRRYLKLQQVTPGIRGNEYVEATWTASDSLDDMTLEPGEGDNPSDFDVDNVADQDARTLYVSKDVPGVAEIVGGPVNATPGADIELSVTRSGQGMKLTMIYPNPMPQAGGDQQQQQFIVVYNALHEEPPNRWPWVGQAQVTDGAGNIISAGIPAAKQAYEWGLLDLNGYQIETGGGTSTDSIVGARRKIYLGTKNGGPAPQLIVKPHTGVVLCYDEDAFRRQFSVPEGWSVFEIKGCDGYIHGARPDIGHRGVGSGFWLDPDGDWIALRAAPRWGDDRRYGAQVSVDNGTSITLTDVTASPDSDSPVTATLASWPSSGYISCDANNALVFYDGVDVAGGRLLNTSTRWNAARQQVNTAVTVSGSVVAFRDLAHWWDFVAYSQTTDEVLRDQFIGKIPGDFPRIALTQNKVSNQNSTGYLGELVWGVWCNASTDTVASLPIAYGDGSGHTFKRQPGLGAGSDLWVSVVDTGKVATAPAKREALRRGYVMGGGVLGEAAYAGAYYYHDSNSAADWTIMATPRIGNVDSLTSTIVMQASLTEHRSAYVVEDLIDTVNDETGQPYYRLEVEDGDALEFPASATDASKYCLVALVQGESPQYLTYQARDSQYFYGVRRVLGSGNTEIPAGTEIKARINTRANSNTNRGNAYVIKNMPAIMGLVYKRWAGLARTSVSTVSTNTIDVPAGSARTFPASGSIRVTASAGYAGNSPAQPWQYTFTYTSRTDSQFSGVSPDPNNTIQSGWAIEQPSGNLSLPADIEIMASREDNPADPATFLGANPSWDIVYTGAHGSQTDATTSFGNRAAKERFYPFGGAAGANPYYQHVCVRVGRMSDVGRVKANSLTILRNPRRIESPVQQFQPSDGGSGLYQGGAFQPIGSPNTGFVWGWNDGTAAWNHLYSAGAVVNDLLVAAGVPARLISAGHSSVGTAPIRSIKLSEGNVWDACRSIARQHGYLICERRDGHIVFVKDPRAPGAPYTPLPLIGVTAETVWGKPTLKEQPRHAVSQLRLEAHNPVGEEMYTVVVPPNPSLLGEKATITGRATTSEYEAEKLARLLWRRANGGWSLSVPMGPFAIDINAGDVLRVNLVSQFDDGGRIPQGDYLVTSIRYQWGDNRLTAIVDISEHVTL